MECHRPRRLHRSCPRFCPRCGRRPVRRQAMEISSDGCRRTQRSSCASAPLTKRPAMIPMPCSRAPNVAPRNPTLPVRWRSLPNCRLPRVPRRSPGSPKPKRAKLRSRPADGLQPMRSWQSPSRHSEETQSMIRVVLYLVLVGLLAVGAAWLADRPGDVVITWQGRRIETSVMVLIMAVMAFATLAVMLWSVARTILRSPEILSTHLRMRRGARGYVALSQGLIAIGSGDARAARRFADEAGRLAPNEPLTLLLNAQAAQLAGDRPAAERTFHTMAGRDDTRLLGLHGLFIEAQRREDFAAATHYAEQAAKSKSAPAWAGQAVLTFRCAAGDWTGALERLDRNMKDGLIERPSYQRQRAVLLTAQALAAEESDRDSAKALTLEAVKLAPTLVPAAALAGRMLGEDSELRKAARIVEAVWKANPHPELAETYAHLRPGDSARDRLVRVQTLAEKAPGHVETALAVARAALDAPEFFIAPSALAPLIIVPAPRGGVLVGRLGEIEPRG